MIILLTFLLVLENLQPLDETPVTRGLTWTDEIRIAILELWINFAKYPWFHKMGGSNKKMARETITKLLETQKIVVKGKSLPLCHVTSVDTLLDNLMGKRTVGGKGKGFSFDPLKPFLEYVDDHMKGMFLKCF